ncbi:hypothetical protein CEXT_89941 [Caerostris extrusa]|uniref:Uncharacterized protein n=1 Tax=Caerostris extrusa TaxID=172846 RepID=A0AAV4WQJ8_CAEEX|nr:hypothetical protein CEXT_89941 [Caerostris extrusa]
MHRNIRHFLPLVNVYIRPAKSLKSPGYHVDEVILRGQSNDEWGQVRVRVMVEMHRPGRGYGLPRTNKSGEVREEGKKSDMKREEKKSCEMTRKTKSSMKREEKKRGEMTRKKRKVPKMVSHCVVLKHYHGPARPTHEVIKLVDPFVKPPPSDFRRIEPQQWHPSMF